MITNDVSRYRSTFDMITNDVSRYRSTFDMIKHVLR